MKIWNRILCCLALCCSVCGAASAGPVRYTFEVDPVTTGYPPFRFAFDWPDFISADTIVPAAAMDYCMAGVYCEEARFRVHSALPGYRHLMDLVFHYNPYASATFAYYFADGAFSSLGTFEAYGGNPGTLTVSAVPEPAAWLGWLAGLAVLAGAHRFSRRARGHRPEAPAIAP